MVDKFAPFFGEELCQTQTFYDRRMISEFSHLLNGILLKEKYDPQENDPMCWELRDYAIKKDVCRMTHGFHIVICS